MQARPSGLSPRATISTRMPGIDHLRDSSSRTTDITPLPRTTDIEVSIIIPTLRREQLLANLIPRCFAQLGCADGQVEVIVVDNCPLLSAKPVVERLSEKFGPSLRYLSERRPGVSHVRNVGVRAARGRFIGFIDDDELPAETWLASMLACLKAHDADVVLGPVYPIFDCPEANNDAFICKTFTQSSDRPTGTVIRPISLRHALLRRPYCYRTMATNNALLNASRCIASEEPFAPALGRLGGEDVLFFHNLYLSGKKVVWCREAVVQEQIPAERLSLGYILRKRYRNGQITSLTCMMTRPRQYPRLAVWTLLGFIQVIFGSAATVVFAPFSSSKAKVSLCTLVGGAGKLLWMRPFLGRSYGLSDGLADDVQPEVLGGSS
jgi:succinoglycan biosynthesis protein ExoM